VRMCLFDLSVVEVVARFGLRPVVFAVVVAVAGVGVELEDLLMLFYQSSVLV
jgi:hypothetical protein